MSVMSYNVHIQLIMYMHIQCCRFYLQKARNTTTCHTCPAPPLILYNFPCLALLCAPSDIYNYVRTCMSLSLEFETFSVLCLAVICGISWVASVGQWPSTYMYMYIEHTVGVASNPIQMQMPTCTCSSWKCCCAVRVSDIGEGVGERG